MRLPHDAQRDGDQARMRKGIEACIGHASPGIVFHVPVVKGDPFQMCLAEHGMKLPAEGMRLTLDRGDPVTNKAIDSCSAR